MISEQEARGKILGKVRPLPARTVPLTDALDCFAAQDYFARLPLPVFDNSAMDGYAVIAADCRERLRLVGEQPAGEDRHLRISRGETVRVFTGAPIPSGADAVVMQEDVISDGNEIVVNTDVDPGEFIRKRGCDLSDGQKIVNQGGRVRPTTLALLASQGFSEMEIGAEVTAAIISTGDELVKAGEQLRPGRIYESNSALLEAMLRRSGATVKSSEHCRDDREALIEAIQRGAGSKVLILSGGVSVGEHDLVKAALHNLGAAIDIWRVAIKPGKPFLFGQLAECLVFGLPGNPVSAFVTFLQFVRPAILKMMSAADHEISLPEVCAKSVVDIENDGDRVHYFRGKLADGKFSPVGRQESHAVFGLSQSNALLRLAPGEKIAVGATVRVQLFD